MTARRNNSNIGIDVARNWGDGDRYASRIVDFTASSLSF